MIEATKKSIGRRVSYIHSFHKDGYYTMIGRIKKVSVNFVFVDYGDGVSEATAREFLKWADGGGDD